MEQKNYEVPEFKKNEQKNKKTKRRQNICTFSSLCLTFYLFVRVFFPPLEVTEKVSVRMRIYLLKDDSPLEDVHVTTFPLVFCLPW